MTAQPEKKHGLTRVIGNWLYSIVFNPGWPRRVLLGAVVILFLVSLLLVTGKTDYREDPSALTPRAAEVYVETDNLGELLGNVSAWQLWAAERRATGQERYNQIQVDIGGLLSERVTGLGTRPLQWLAAAGRAAYCEAPDENGAESWALYLQLGDPAPFISELLVDQTLQIESVEGTHENGIITVTGQGGGALHLGIIAPWLIVSSADTLPKFAFTGAKQPALSLAESGLLPDWKRGAVLRGVYNPASRADSAALSASGIIAGWMAPEMRINFISSFRDGVETTMNAGVLSDKVRGGGLWPLVWLLLLIVAVVTLVLALALGLVMIGWGGWLKVMAMRAGIAPASAPVPVEPSAAFAEDAGLVRTDAAEAEEPALPAEPVESPEQVEPLESGNPDNR